MARKKITLVDLDPEWRIGNAFDYAEEARYELEEQAEAKLRALARRVPQPHRGDLLQLQREHIGYATGLIRSACSRLRPLLRPHLVYPYPRQGTRLRYKPAIETRKALPQKALPSKISAQLFHYEQHLLTAVRPKTRRHYGNVLWNFFDRFRNRKRLEEIQPSDVSSYRVQRRGEGVGTKAVSAEIAIVRAFFAWAMARNDRIKRNPASQ